MDLNFTEEQKLLRDMVRNLCEEHSSTRVVRDMENDPLGVPPGLWTQMKDTGLLAMMLPEAYGGIGLDMLDRAVIYHEFGRALAPGPHFASSVMGALAIEKGGSQAQKDALLTAIGQGGLIVAPAWLAVGLPPSSETICILSLRTSSVRVLISVVRLFTSTPNS